MPCLDKNLAAPPFCLIGGTGRCGTTVLSRVLGLHPALTDVPEWRFSIDPDGLIDFYATLKDSWSPYLYDVKLRRLARLLKRVGRGGSLGRVWSRFMRSTGAEQLASRHLVSPYASIDVSRDCPRFPQFVAELLEDLGALRYTGHWLGSELWQSCELSYASCANGRTVAERIATFYGRIATDVVTRQGARCYMEKNTWNILWFDILREILPAATLVHIYRDPRDVVASYTKQRWAPTDPAQAARFYRQIIERWWCVRARAPENAWMEISLENLVAQPESTLRSVCDFWGLEWVDSLLRADLSRGNFGRWRRDLTPSQQKQVCDILEPVLVKLGYER